jgi:hypothetical protein
MLRRCAVPWLHLWRPDYASGRKHTWLRHSSDSLADQIKRRSSMIAPTGEVCCTINSPAIVFPSASRTYASAGIVLTS